MPEGLLLDPENLISFDEVIDRAKSRGVSFGKGNPYNRLRYYTKIGLLPLAKRKSFGGHAPTGAYPESVVATVIEIDKKLRSGKSVQAILREHKEQPISLDGPARKVSRSPLEHLPKNVIITPIPVIKPPPFSPKVQAPAFEKGPPYEPFVPQEPMAIKLLKKVKPIHYATSIIALTILSLPLLYFTNTGIRNTSRDILITIKSLNPVQIQEQAERLELPSEIGEVLGTVTDPFLTVNVETDILGPLNAKAGIKTFGKDVDAATGDVYASNLIYSISPGENVAVSGDQDLTISVPDVVTGSVIRSVIGTVNKIVSSGGTNPAIDIAPTYPGQTSINTLGTVSTGVWQATAIGARYGGTGQTSYSSGDILYATGATSLQKLNIGGAGEVLTVAGGIPDWQAAAVGAPTDASYITVSAEAGLSAERVLTGGTNISVVDGGGTITVNVSPQGAGSNLDADLLDGVSSAAFAQKALGETITGAWIFNNLTIADANIPFTGGDTTFDVQGATTTLFISSSSGTASLNVEGTGDFGGDVTISGGGDLVIGAIGLSDAGTSSITSGAFLVGVYSTPLTNSSGDDVQEVLEDLDAAIGAGSSKWTITGNNIHPTTTTLDLAIGSNDITTAALGVDESANIIYIGDGALAGDTMITFKAGTGPSVTGNLIYNTSDQFQFSGGAVVISTGASGLILGSGVNATTLSSTATAARAINFPDDDTTLVGTDTSQALTNKTYEGNTITTGTGTLTLGTNTLTVSGASSINQNVTTTGSPTFSTLNLSAAANQLVFNSGGIGGTLSWTPTVGTATVTIPDTAGVADTVCLLTVGNCVGTAVNSFETINAPAGTDPVAESGTDTLNLTVTGTNFTVTGDSTTDTIDFNIVESVLAGDGLGVSGDALVINTSTGLTTSGDNVIVDQDFSFAWTADHTWTLAGAEDLAINSSIAADISVNPLNITFTDNAAASTGTIYIANITNADNGVNVGVPDALLRLNNANAAETVADGLFIEQTGASTLTNAIRIKQTAGTITNLLQYDNGTNTGSLRIAALTGNNIYTLPDTAGGSDNFCLQSLANCFGSGGGVTSPGGVATRVAFFTGGQTIDDDINFYWDDANEGLILGSADTIANARLEIQPASAAAIQINPFGAAAGNTGELRFLELTASGSEYTGFKAPDALGSNILYTLPGASGSSDYVLTWQTGNVMQWKSIGGAGGGDIDAVGDVTSGPAFTSGTVAGTELFFHNSGFTAELTVGTLGASRIYTLPDLGTDGTFAFLQGTQTFTGAKTFSTDVGFTFTGIENIEIVSDLAGTVDVLSLIGTPSASAGTAQGIFIQQANSANSNGLDAALVIDNADLGLAITDAILITDTGGGGYTTILNTPSLDISGAGAITGATGITSSGTITFSGLSAGGLVEAAAGTGTLGIATAGTDYEVPLTFQNALTRTVDTVELGGSLNQNTTIAAGNSFSLTITSDLSAGARSTNVLTISQPNDATNDSNGNLLRLTNSDAGSGNGVLFIAQVSGGVGIDLFGVGTGVNFITSLDTGNTGIDFGGTLTNGAIGLDIPSSRLTSGNAINIGGSISTSLTAFTSDMVIINPTRTHTGATAIDDTGNFLDIARSNTMNNASGTFTISGDLATLSSNCTVTAGTCTDTSNILELNQQFATASGAVLNILNSGTGADISLDTGGTIEATSGDLNLRTTTSGDIILTPASISYETLIQRTLRVTSLLSASAAGITIHSPNNGNPALVFRDDGGAIDDWRIHQSSVPNVLTITNYTDSRDDIAIYSSGSIDLGAADVAKTINIGTGSSDDTINIGTGGGADTINIGGGSLGNPETINFGSSVNSPTFTFTSGTGAGGDMVTINASGTSGIVGNALLIQQTSTGTIIDAIDVSDSAGITNAINIGANAIAGTNFSVTGAGLVTYVADGADNNTAVCQNAAGRLAPCTGGGSSSLWTDGGTYIYPTDAEVLGNSAAAGANKIAGIYLGDSNPFYFGTDNDINFSFDNATTTLDVSTGNTSSIDIISDLSAGARSIDVLTITQADTGFDSSENLLQLTNLDAGSTVALLDISQVTTGTGINISGIGGSGTGISLSVGSGTGISISGTGGTAISLPDSANGNGIVGGTVSVGGIGINFTGSVGTISGFTGDVIRINQTRTSTATIDDTGSSLDIVRSNVINDAVDTFTVSGDLVTFASNCTETAGTCTDTANILQLDQQYASASGAVLNILNAGTSAGINLTFSNVGTVNDGILFANPTGTLTDAIDVSAANITNALNAGRNFILFDGIRAYSPGSGSLTIEDTSGNDFLTIVDRGTAAEFKLTTSSGAGVGQWAVNINVANGADSGGVRIQNTGSDVPPSQGLLTLDEAGGNLPNALLITTNATIVDAVDASDSDITNAINLGQNYALFDGIRAYSPGSGSLTIEDTSGNDFLTIVDRGTAAEFKLTTSSGAGVGQWAVNINVANGADSGGVRIQNTGSDVPPSQGLLTLDEAGGNLPNALLITTNATIVDAVDASDSDITNAINLGQNYALFDGIRAYSPSSGNLTIEDTSGNDFLTIADQGAVATFNFEASGPSGSCGFCVDLNNTSLSEGARISANGNDMAASGGILHLRTDNSLSSVPNGLLITTIDGTITDAIDVADATGITNALNVGPNDIVGTTPAINFTNFDVSSAGLITYAANGTADNNAYVCKNSSNQLSTCSNGGGALGFVSLAPAAFDADTSANPSIWINDTGGGNILQLTNGDTVFADNVLDASIASDQIDNARFFDGTSYTDNDAEANSAGGTAYTLLGDAVDDAFFFGNATTFSALNFDIDTAATSATLVWEYCSVNAVTNSPCDTWAAVSSLTDGTTGFTTDGLVTWTDPGGSWINSNEDSAGEKKWLRVRATALTGTPTAFFSTISIFTGNFLDFSNVSSSRFTVDASGNITRVGHITPLADDTYDLGSSTLRWRDLYLGPSTLFIGASGDEMQISFDTATDILNIGDGTNSFLSIDDQGTTAFVGINKAAPTVALDVTGNMLVTSSETSGNAVSIVANSVDTGNVISVSADGLTTGAGLNISSSSISGDGGRLVQLNPTFNPSTGGSQYGIKLDVTNVPTTTTNTAYGAYISISDSSGIANTTYGLYVTNTAGSAIQLKYGVYSVGYNYGVVGRGHNQSYGVLGVSSNLMPSNSAPGFGVAGIRTEDAGAGAGTIPNPGGRVGVLGYDSLMGTPGVAGVWAGSELSTALIADLLNNGTAIASFRDIGIEVFQIANVSGTAANGFTFTGAIASATPTFAVTGSDTNISLNTSLKGTGSAIFSSTTTNTDSIAIKPQTTSAIASFTGTITSEDLTDNRTWTFPDATGTVCVSGDTCATSGIVGYWGRTGTTLSSATANDVLDLTFTSAPTIDILTLSNSGQASTTDGIDALVINFSAANASGNLIDLTPSFSDTDAGNNAETWNVIDINNFTVTQNDTGGAVTGIVNGLNIGNLTETPTGDDAITSTAINIGSGWDNSIRVADGDLNLTIAGINDNVNINNVTDLIINTSFAGAFPSGIVINSPSNARPGIRFNDPSSDEDWLIEQFSNEFHIRNWSDSRNDITIYDSGSIDLGAADVVKTINIGTGTAADTINIGTGDTSADTINIGNTDVITTINISSGMTTTQAVNIVANSINTGTGVKISVDGLTGGVGLLVELTPSSGASTTSADLIRGVFTPPYGINATLSGNVLDLSRNATQNWSSGTLTVTGAVATISDNCGGVGTCTHSANVLSLNQQYASATGAVLNIINSGSGADISLANGETIDNNTDNTIILASDAANGAGVLRLPVKTSTGDPTLNVEGNIYYNTTDNKFRCYQNTGWTDCIGSGGSSLWTDQTTYIEPNTLTSGNFSIFDAGGGLNIGGTSDPGAGNLTISGGELFLTGITSSGSTTEGTIYYDSDDDQLKVYANAKWQSDRTVATVIVGTSNGSGASRNYEKADYVCGASDCDTTIESAIAALPAGGGIVYLLEGLYIVDSNGIDIIKSNVSIIGAGKSTILQRGWDAASNDGVITVGDNGTTAVSGVTIADLSINGCKAVAGDCSTAYTGTANTGIFFNNAVTYSTIRNTYLHDNDGRGIFLDGATTATTNNFIQGNDTRDNGNLGIYLSSSANNNTVTGNNSQGNSIHGIALFSASNNTVTGNTVEGNTGQGLSIFSSSYNTVTGNTVEGNSIYGILLVSSSNNTVTGNNMEGNGLYGITLEASSYNTVIGNHVAGHSSYGIELDSSANNNTVTGNKVHNNGGSGSSSGIRIDGSDGNLISSNDITDTTGTGYAINVFNATSDDNYLIGNRYSGTGASSINDAGTGTTIQHREQFEVENTLAITNTNVSFFDHTATYSATSTLSGNLISAARTLEIDTAAQTLTISGDLANLTSNCTVTLGTCTDTANILELNQQYASATGAVLNILGAGTGNLATLDATNASANGVLIDVQSSASTEYALSVTSNNGATNGLYVRADGNVGIGTTTPGAALEIAGNLLFTKEVARTLQIADSTTADTAGAALTIKGAAGAATNAAGGALNLTGGAGAGSEPGGALVFTAGAGGATGTGGAITIAPGTAAGVGKSRGNITIGDSTAGGLSSSGNTISIVASKGGDASPLTGGAGGSISLTTGAGGAGGGASPTGGAGGSFTVTAGAGGSANANAGTGGSIILTGGQGGGTSTSTGGSITITSGAGGSNSGNSGALTLATGAVTSGSFGTISFKQDANFRMFIDANGDVGIDDITPDAKLDVDANVVGYAGGFFNDGNLDTHQGVFIQACLDLDPTSSCNFLELRDGDGTILGAIEGNGSGGVTNASAGSDYAELFAGNLSDFEAGDVIALDNTGAVVKAGEGSEPLGVFSTNSNTLGNWQDGWEETGNWVPVGLLGQIETKISTENGNITPGDPLTSSSVAGVAMKATESGPIVGKALEAYSGADVVGKIMVFVSVGWYVAPLETSGQGPGTSLTGLTSISTETLTAGTITTDVLFIGDRKLSMGPAGELIIDGSVNILGDVTISGDLDIDGILGATTVSAETIQIDIPKPDPDTGKSKATIGEETLVAGETQILIETTTVKADSKIFVTASSLTDKVLSVSDLVEGESFKVQIPTVSTSNIQFNWWIVQVASAGN